MILRVPRAPASCIAHVLAAVVAAAALSACDPKPSSPPAPKAGVAEGPTAAGGGPPSASYPAGIRPAPSGDQVASTSSNPAHKGPSEGGAAIGGLSAGQGGGASASGGTPAPTPGDGATPAAAAPASPAR
ncbi:hypothetical protein QTH87_19410 [Variovorax sp. J22P168]|uniref:hypothetical protein n=1 Tax=Variovorax jilinensis TaxID=3053513 RepID=UPI00257761B9|nr:hypothetical protein [Variovorax sp. J22P168]MDM0014619.1 hypothetical protein [Variovorax sp. J22P168]